MFNSVEAANKAAKIAVFFLLFVAAVLYHRYDMQLWPFNQQALQRQLDTANSTNDLLVSEVKKLDTLNVELIKTVRQQEVERILADTFANLQLNNALMAQELKLVKEHSAEIVSLTKSHKEEVVGVLNSENLRKHELARNLIEVSGRYADRSGCYHGKPDAKPQNLYFRFSGEVRDTSVTVPK